MDGDAPRTTVEIVDGDRCGRFTSTVLTGVAIGPSAPWMAERLTAAGMRPINNVVDVSNYVMLELGQPNHAYDLATLGGHGFRIRTARDGEEIVTLDDVTRRLAPTDLLICDALDVPIGIGGIMGGADTEISDATTAVALEIAWFEPVGIGLSVARLGLRSEASARNERGVDAWQIDTSIARFVELLAETCPDLAVQAGAVDARGAALPPRDRSCDVRISEVNRIIGTTLTADDLPPLLDPIGFTVSGTGDTRTVALPTWRGDSSDEIDVIEEVARMYGYDRVGKVVPTSTVHGRLSVRQQRRRRLRDVLLGLGITEAMPNPFLAPDTLRRAGLDGDALRITNPLVAEESVLRTSLRPGLLRAVAFNESHRRSGVALFEIGHVYPPGPGELPDEHEALGIVLAGEEAPAAVAVWREIAAALGVGARIDQGRVPAGPPRHAVGHARRRPRCHRRRRRGRSRTCSRRSTSPSASRCSSSTSVPSSVRNRSRRRGSRRAGTRPATSTWRSRCPTTCPPRSSTRRSARAPARCSSTSPCSTCTAGPAWARGGAASPTACACRPRTATSPTPTSPTSGRR